MSVFLDALDSRVLVFDGAMGTQLQARDLSLEAYWGQENCSEVLNLSRPDVIREIHRDFLRAGADVVETNSFGGSPLVLAEFDLEERVGEINRVSAELAREACDSFQSESKPRFVAGSIGPGTRLPSLGQVGWDEMEAAYIAQVEGLLDGGVDLLIVETCQDLLQTKCALSAIQTVFENRERRWPVMAQVTMETTGTMLVGTELGAACTVLEGYAHVDLLGLNCATGPQEMAAHVGHLGRHCRKKISVLPNAGLPQLVNGEPSYPLSPSELADWHERFVREDGVNVVGGCCGTVPEHIREVVARVSDLKPKRRHPEFTPSVASLYSAVSLKQDADILAIGERTNANGSRRFKRLLLEEDWEGISLMGKRQASHGSHAIDVCTAIVGRAEIPDMCEVLFRFNTQVQAPLVVDSTEVPVIEEAMKRIAGKGIINSINLEDGEGKCDTICALAKRYRMALVALTIDEEGMARKPEDKLRIAERLYDIAVNRHGLDPADLLFDPLTFTICTGNEDDRQLGLWTLEGIELIAQRFPRCSILLGVSNISFGLDPGIRQVLNSVFLYYAKKAGLTAAIVHASKILPLHRIPEAQRQAAEDLVFDRRKEGYDPLMQLLSLFDGEKEQKAERPPPAEVEERLKERIVDGERSGIEADLQEALQKYAALEIINDILLSGMKTVGELFGSGQMQLPFVLQSAETMKVAVAWLEPHMEKEEGLNRGCMVLATVRGDVHDIGKNLVDIILSNNGYKVVNLGIKQPVDAILEAWKTHDADAIGMSGLLVKSTVIMRESLLEMERKGIQSPVILGGAALTRSFVEQDCSAAYGMPVAYGRDAFGGLAFMGELEKAREEGRVSQWAQPIAVEAEVPQVPDRAARPLPEHERDPSPVESVEVPERPFEGTRVLELPARALVPYLNRDVLYKFQWGYLKKGMSPEEHEEQLRTVVDPILVNLLRRAEEEEIFSPKAVYGWFPCRPEGDSLVLEDGTRLSFPRQAGEGGRCISDYFHPEGDLLGLMAVTIGEKATEVCGEWFAANDYRNYLYLHGLSVELAEAMSEFLHRQMRVELGISGDDDREISGLIRGKYRGSRFAYGYPACPEMADQQHMLRLLEADRIGLSMDTEEQLHPEQSTAALVVHHPRARYFRV